MRILRWTGLTIALIAAAVVTGCVYDAPDYPGRYPRGRYSEERDGTLQGTVERVSRRDHVIVLAAGEDGGQRRYGRDEVVLFYDDDTTVEYQGREYRPEDLERGDRVQASVDSRGGRPVAEHIEVVYDASSGRGEDRGEDRDRGDMPPDRPDRPGPPDREAPGVQVEPSEANLQGTIRGVDTDGQSLEIELASDDDDSSDAPSGVVVVRYDAQTTVQYQGRSYKPENLEEGDVVEIHLRRGRGGRPVAEQILVLGEGGQVSPSRTISTG
jgi:hypothetical protein